MERRLIPVNAILDLAVDDGLNPAPLAAVGWRVAALEVPVIADAGTTVCDVVLFNAESGDVLAAEAKSGANIEPEQGHKLVSLTPQALVVAGGITVPQPVPLHYQALFVCLEEHAERITIGIEDAHLLVPILVVGDLGARLLRPELSPAKLSAALRQQVTWTHPIARIIPFDHESPDGEFDQPVRAELIAVMAKGRSYITIRALTEQVVGHFALYGRGARGMLIRKVRAAARRSAEVEPDRLRYERSTGTTEERVAILLSPETFDRRGRTQGYQAIWTDRPARRRRPTEIPGQIDLFSELDDAERVTAEKEGDNSAQVSDDAGSTPATAPAADGLNAEVETVSSDDTEDG
jgi:hypothetical protein